MLVYTYDLAGAYLETIEVDRFKPLPKRSTLKPPPSVGEGEVAVWSGGWQIQPILPEPEPDLEELRQSLKAQATALHWQKETGGITLANGIQIATGTEDQNRITTVIANAQLAGVESVDFKAATGWITLNLQQIQSIAAAIALHVQACFSSERAHHEAIDSLESLHELQTYDLTTGWPT